MATFQPSAFSHPASYGESTEIDLVPTPEPEGSFVADAAWLAWKVSGPLAIGLSYATYNKVGWALLAGLFGPTYLAYRGFQYMRTN